MKKNGRCRLTIKELINHRNTRCSIKKIVNNIVIMMYGDRR